MFEFQVFVTVMDGQTRRIIRSPVGRCSSPSTTALQPERGRSYERRRGRAKPPSYTLTTAQNRAVSVPAEVHQPGVHQVEPDQCPGAVTLDVFKVSAAADDHPGRVPRRIARHDQPGVLPTVRHQP